MNSINVHGVPRKDLMKEDNSCPIVKHIVSEIGIMTTDDTKPMTSSSYDEIMEKIDDVKGK